MSVMQAATAGPTCALKTSRTGSALPPIPSGWRCRRGQPANLVGAGHDGLEDDSHREGRGDIEGCCDRLRVLGDRLESLGAIEVLVPGDELDLVGVEIQS